MNPSTIGLIRGVGTVVLFAVLSYFGDATHLTGVFTPEIAGLIAAVVLAVENSIEGKTGNALFGAVESTGK